MVDFAQLIVLSVGLALDAASVSAAAGLKDKRPTSRTAFKLAGSFGLFQALMPVLGFFIGEVLFAYISGIDHWVAFGLLSFVGIKIIKESFKKNTDTGFIVSADRILVLSLATSIDALIVGLTLKYLNYHYLFSALVIGLITFALCFFAYYCGKKAGLYMRGKIEAVGGAAITLIGLKILLSHLL